MEQTIDPELAQTIRPLTPIPPPSITSITPIDPSQIDATFSSTCIDLITETLSPNILHISDEFFAPASNLLNPLPPTSKPFTFIESGQWYDGWETRRHNRSSFDFVIIRLGVSSGIVRGVEIDTAFFNGNHAPAVSVEGCYATGQEADQEVVNGNYVGWQEMLPVQKCEPSQRHAWIIPEGRKPITHVRLRMYPDGGIARFRLYGVAVPVWPEIDAKSQEVQLSAAQMGGRAVAVSNQHYGKGFNVLLPGRGKNMGDGWETKRSRTEGHVDWVVVRLGARGKVGGLLIDTMHFRGNFPREIRVHGWDAGDGTEVVFSKEEWEKQDWIEVLGETPMKADTEFSFRGGELKNVEGRLFTHMRLTIIPDGGVKRFRVFGTKA